MSFDALLGNERLKENISRSLASGRSSHFYLISGPRGSGKHTLAQLLAAGLLCQGDHKPCLTCTHCRKVLSGNHPDFIPVRDQDHKNLPVKLVRQIRDEMFIRPNEGAKKIYMFHQDMGIEGQNALLKVLEEPPSYGVFMILTENPDTLLPTIRSRCIHLAMTGLSDACLEKELKKRFPDTAGQDIHAAMTRSGGYLGQAITLLEGESIFAPQSLSFAEHFLKKDEMNLTLLLVSMEKMKRDQALVIFEQWYQILHSALMCRSGMDSLAPNAREIARSRSPRELLSAIETLQKAILYTKSNVSVAAICGHLAHALQ